MRDAPRRAHAKLSALRQKKKLSSLRSTNLHIASSHRVQECIRGDRRDWWDSSVNHHERKAAMMNTINRTHLCSLWKILFRNKFISCKQNVSTARAAANPEYVCLHQRKGIRSVAKGLSNYLIGFPLFISTSDGWLPCDNKSVSFTMSSFSYSDPSRALPSGACAGRPLWD